MFRRRIAECLISLGLAASSATACGARSNLADDGLADAAPPPWPTGGDAGSTDAGSSPSADSSSSAAVDATAPPGPSDAGDVRDTSVVQDSADLVDEGAVLADASDAQAPSADGGTCPTCPGSCIDGRCVVTLATGQGNPYALAVDANNLYWTDYAGGRVLQLSLAGGAPVALATGQMHPKFIAVDASRVYWTDDATVMAVPIGGGPLVTLASGQVGATGIAVDDTYVYWTNNYGGSVRKVPLAGGKLATLAQGQSTPWALAINHSAASWTNDSNFGVVAMVPLDGGAPVTLASGISGAPYDPAGIAMDDVNIYWAQSSFGGPVYSQPVDGGAATVLATENGPYGIAIDSDFVYFSAPNGGPSYTGAVERVPKSGGPTVILATTALGQYPEAIAVDATSVYWGNSGDGSIAKVTPK